MRLISVAFFDALDRIAAIMKRYKLAIVGSGPAGYTAAIYAARAELAPVLFEGLMSGPIGGQLATTTEVENYPGFPEGIMGPELMDLFRRQAQRFGTEYLTEDVTAVNLKSHPFTLTSSSGTIQADAIIIATGATAKRLEIPGAGDHELWQKGVSACAVCDGALPLFRGKELFVVGGGDTAMEEALFLTKYASRVHVVHRRDQFRASKIMAERVMRHPKIKILWNSVVDQVKGEKVVEQIVIHNVQTNEKQEQAAGGLFFAIGHEPNTRFLEGQLPLTPNGYMIVEAGSCRTKVPGVFAAGDVQDPYYRQAITAAGSGCMAALEAERWLAAQEH
jgi:thioredoxin reductase (NADPH)